MLLPIETLSSLRLIAEAAAASGVERIRVDPAHVVALIDDLDAQDAAREKNANEHLDLICRLHVLADEYAGPVAIDSTPESDIEAIENALAGAQVERDAMASVVTAADALDAELYGMGGSYGCTRDALHDALCELRKVRKEGR